VDTGGGGGPGPGGGSSDTDGGTGTGSSDGTSDGATGGDTGTTGGISTGDTGATDSGSDTETEPPAECGNGAVETGEECDGGDLGGATCESEGFVEGAIACNPDCTLDTSGCTMCGNDTVDTGEECDGTDLGGLADCEDVGLGAADELLACNDDCTYDYTRCSGCPDGSIVDPEDCEPGDGNDPPDLDGETCETLGFDGGTLDCDSGCVFDTTACYLCGDNVAAGPEECDGADFAGATCGDYPSQAGPSFTGGSLTCDASCTISTENCTYCGDALITGNEVCDGQNVALATCENQGFTEGTLTCNATCDDYDVSACTLCGDSVAEGNEQCDDTDFLGEDCVTQGYDAGDLACTVDCEIDASGCVGFECGDGMVNASDDCDCGQQGSPCTDEQLDYKDCTGLDDPTGTPFTGGTLACNSPLTCTFDTDDCWWCGNDEVETGEDCDGGVGANNCTTIGQGFTAGSLLCGADCDWDTSGCTTCGDGVLETGETCDCGAVGSPCTSGQLGGTACINLDSPLGTPYDGGTLACQTPTSCDFDESGCYYCGDGTIDPNEDCDGTNLGGNDCTTVPGGFAGGTLGCDGSCNFDTSGCSVTSYCGDGTCDPGEDSCSCPADCPDDPNACSPCECGSQGGGTCWCDSACTSFGDCCDLGDPTNNYPPGLPGTACYECSYCY
jgi:hypothetical protein